jgi:hypothetical protein
MDVGSQSRHTPPVTFKAATKIKERGDRTWKRDTIKQAYIMSWTVNYSTR